MENIQFLACQYLAPKVPVQHNNNCFLKLNRKLSDWLLLFYFLLLRFYFYFLQNKNIFGGKNFPPKMFFFCRKILTIEVANQQAFPSFIHFSPRKYSCFAGKFNNRSSQSNAFFLVTYVRTYVRNGSPRNSPTTSSNFGCLSDSRHPTIFKFFKFAYFSSPPRAKYEEDDIAAENIDQSSLYFKVICLEYCKNLLYNT